MAEKRHETEQPVLPQVGHIVVADSDASDYERQWSPEHRFAPQPAHNLPPGTAHLPRPVYVDQADYDRAPERAEPAPASPAVEPEAPAGAAANLGVNVAPVKGAGRASS
jgi:hypothetical protein